MKIMRNLGSNQIVAEEFKKRNNFYWKVLDKKRQIQ